MSLPRALEKLRDHARQPLPPHKLTIGIFSKLWLGEKSASLIVEALYSSVKKILRCRCRVANRRFPGFFPLPLYAVAQAARLEKSHNRLTCCSATKSRIMSGTRHEPAGAGCAILDPTAVNKLHHRYTGGPHPRSARRSAHARQSAPTGWSE